MKNYIIPALLIAIAILSHAYITKPVPQGVVAHPSKSAFEKATKEALQYTIENIGKGKEVKGISTEARFSHDGTMVAVEYKVEINGQNITSSMIFKGDEFGRYLGEGSFDGQKVLASIK